MEAWAIIIIVVAILLLLLGLGILIWYRRIFCRGTGRRGSNGLPENFGGESPPPEGRHVIVGQSGVDPSYNVNLGDKLRFFTISPQYDNLEPNRPTRAKIVDYAPKATKPTGPHILNLGPKAPTGAHTPNLAPKASSSAHTLKLAPKASSSAHSLNLTPKASSSAHTLNLAPKASSSAQTLKLPPKASSSVHTLNLAPKASSSAHTLNLAPKASSSAHTLNLTPNASTSAQISNFIWKLPPSPQPKYEDEKLMLIRRIQDIQMTEAELYDPDYATGLIIGVDATPRGIGGYCIDLDARACEYYALGSKELPWELRDTSNRGNSAEFEMKNLLFALHLWEDLIAEKDTVQVYTDNRAVLKGQNNEYGQRAERFIQHFKKCAGVDISYSVTGSGDLDQFSRFIQPADDFSRNELGKGLQYLATVYNLVTLYGAFATKEDKKPVDPKKFLQRVKGGVRRWREVPCPEGNCDYSIENSDSLRSTSNSTSIRLQKSLVQTAGSRSRTTRTPKAGIQKVRPATARSQKLRKASLRS